MIPYRLDINKIRQRLRTSIIGREIVHYDSTVSTNLDAMRLAKDGSADGMVVIADEQTGGRGRFDRVWISPKGKNILMSVILRPQIESSRLFFLTVVASLAVCHAIKTVTGLTAKIKWPNDVYLGFKKACGILTEMEMKDGFLGYAVVGMGININAHPDLDTGHAVQATSLAAELGREVEREDIIIPLLEEMDRRYQMLLKGSTKVIIEDWTRQSLVLGKPVTITDIGGTIEGIAESFDDQGRLILLTEGGSRVIITSGDVTLRF